MKRTLTDALGGLTVRGRGFLTSGITAMVAGLVLLERDLVRVGVVVALLPLVAVGFLMARRQQLTASRELLPARLAAGETGTVTITVTNQGRQHSTLLVEDGASRGLGDRPRFALPGLTRGGHARLRYTVSPELRGRYVLGPLSVRQREPFGMVERRVDVQGTDDLLVLPHVVPLAPLRLTGDGDGSGEDRPRHYSTGSVADVIVRGYRVGDDLRRVHWPSTARTGEIMVRNEEQLWRRRATVLVDHRAHVHQGAGAGSSLEAAVTVAASVVAHLVGQDYRVRLVTDDGVADCDPEPGSDAALEALRLLATLEVTRNSRLPDVPVEEGQGSGVIVGVVGLVGRGPQDAGDREWWGRFPRLGSASVALALDTASWGQRRGAPVPAPAAWLLEQGWRVGLLGKGDDVATTWRGLDR